MDEPLERLVEIMARLRGPDGCPWDREQTLDTLKTYLLEESHEVREAMDSGDPAELKEELGDLLFQVIFQSRIAEELGWFGIRDVAAGIADKLVRRHPHVFGESRLSSSREVVRQWEELKEEERRSRAKGSRLAGVPRSLPALLRALRLSEKASRVGFDWETTDQVFDKVQEEIREWEVATQKGDAAEAANEMGDLLFSLVNVARRMGIDPEAALQSANHRFTTRFGWIEDFLAREGKGPEGVSAARLEQLWEGAKQAGES
jgi:tetrapyrrole methylase family protein/MazG family protein/ATP diphosphatase